MTEPRFIQFHWFASYPGTLLNRDDAGLAKVLPFGGAIRTRISSQCLKRHWRKADDVMNIGSIPGIETAERSKELIERAVMEGISGDAEVIKEVSGQFCRALYGKKGDEKKNRQALLLGWPEIRYMQREAARLVETSTDKADAKRRCEEFFSGSIKKVFEAVRAQASIPGGFEAALFGRMVTSDPESNIDAAVHVAHAITVHEAQKELDYFTVVDDLKRDDEDAGAAGIFDAELTSGLYYGYAVVDVPALISNLSGVPAKDWNKAEVSRELAGEVAARLTHLIATVSPGAKKGSTAPYAYAETVLVEAGNRQPRTLANAFRKPVSLRGDVEEGALRAMRDQIKGFDRSYGPGEARCALHANGHGSLVEEVAGPLKSLPELSEWVKKAIVAAQV